MLKRPHCGLGANLAVGQPDRHNFQWKLRSGKVCENCSSVHWNSAWALPFGQNNAERGALGILSVASGRM